MRVYLSARSGESSIANRSSQLSTDTDFVESVASPLYWIRGICCSSFCLSLPRRITFHWSLFCFNFQLVVFGITLYHGFTTFSNTLAFILEWPFGLFPLDSVFPVGIWPYIPYFSLFISNWFASWAWTTFGALRRNTWSIWDSTRAWTWKPPHGNFSLTF